MQEYSVNIAPAVRGARNEQISALPLGELSLSKNLFFDRLAEVKGAVKTSKPISLAYIGTVESGLRSKSKCLAQQGFADLVQLHGYLTF